jgi:adenosylcobyric acid synthase
MNKHKDQLQVKNRARALMIVGTSSHAGKSVIATAFCRLFAERGIRVAPFKAQNMSLNSYVTPEGGEIGRAQAAQAEAAGIEPHVHMNPILLKPAGGVSQVVVLGEPVATLSAREYYAAKDRFWLSAVRAYDELASRYEVVVLEGAGSPVEINLIEHDLANYRSARHADAAIVVVADIERGGVFAQIVGTWELTPEVDRERIVGFLINKFRGDPTLLESGLRAIESRTGKPVLGVLPFLEEIRVDQEDSLSLEDNLCYNNSISEIDCETIDVAVVRPPSISNFTDFDPFRREPGVRLRFVREARELGEPDLVVLPGSKATASDLAWLRDRGFADRIERLALDPGGPIVIGICGGFQMLGDRIDDPEAVESENASIPGLGLLGVVTRFSPIKQRFRVSGSTRSGPIAALVRGYEIHMGRTDRAPGVEPWIDVVREPSGEKIADGAVDRSGRIFGTYIHGVFDHALFCDQWIDYLRRRRGLSPIDQELRSAFRAARSDRYGSLAEALRTHVDLETIDRALDGSGRTP